MVRQETEVPGWLQKKQDEIDLRSNDPAYLAYVRRLWEKVYEQAKGFLYQDGGPVIGMQIENEYGHVGGYNGEKGEQHMRTLTAMAREIGFDLPLCTATGWGRCCDRRTSSCHGRLLRSTLGSAHYRD